MLFVHWTSYQRFSVFVCRTVNERKTSNRRKRKREKRIHWKWKKIYIKFPYLINFVTFWLIFFPILCTSFHSIAAFFHFVLCATMPGRHNWLYFQHWLTPLSAFFFLNSIVIRNWIHFIVYTLYSTLSQIYSEIFHFISGFFLFEMW